MSNIIKSTQFTDIITIFSYFLHSWCSGIWSSLTEKMPLLGQPLPKDGKHLPKSALFKTNQPMQSQFKDCPPPSGSYTPGGQYFFALITQALDNKGPSPTPRWIYWNYPILTLLSFHTLFHVFCPIKTTTKDFAQAFLPSLCLPSRPWCLPLGPAYYPVRLSLGIYKNFFLHNSHSPLCMFYHTWLQQTLGTFHNCKWWCQD